MTIYKHIIIFFILIIAISDSIYSQDNISKEVQVVKAFKPIISDASKINKLPEIVDTIEVIPEFKYEIFPKPIQTKFKAQPLKAAQMVGEPLTDLFGKYAKLGLGNRFTPLLEFYINNLRSKDYSYGAYFKHLSSSGKIKLQNNKKVYAGYFDDEISFYGKKYHPYSFLSSDITIEGLGRHHYGYNTAIDTILEKDDIKKRFLGILFNSKFKSNYHDSLHLNYNVDINYQYFSDNYSNSENNFLVKAHLNKFFDTEKIGADISINYIENNISSNVSDLIIFKASPWIGKFGDRWQVKVGISAILENSSGKTKPNFYPKAFLQYNIVNNYVVPYAGVNGDFNQKSFRSLALENPYYNKILSLKPNNEKIMLFGGIRGNINDITSFNIKASFTVIDTLYFYVNNSDMLSNSFNLVFDDVQVKNIYAEFETHPTNNFTLGAKGNYYTYELQNLKYAWHKPKYDLTIWYSYKLLDKIYLDTELFVVGQKYVENLDIDRGYEILESAIDLNLKAEYNYTNQISGFIQLNNLLGSHYYLWNNYPSQKFTCILGASYSF